MKILLGIIFSIVILIFMTIGFVIAKVKSEIIGLSLIPIMVVI